VIEKFNTELSPGKIQPILNPAWIAWNKWKIYKVVKQIVQVIYLADSINFIKDDDMKVTLIA
jgi:hypothetical protein